MRVQWAHKSNLKAAISSLLVAASPIANKKSAQESTMGCNGCSCCFNGICKYKNNEKKVKNI